MRSDAGRFKIGDADLIERHSIPEPNSGCWLWIGSTSNRFGYGRVSQNRRERLAHRLSYLAHNGPIPLDMHVLHRCDVAICVNPDHLFLGTLKDNVQDCLSKGRHVALRGESHRSSKLNRDKVASIRASSASISELARDFGVSRRAIRFVKTGATWTS
jgi:hypothetical protein